MYLIKLTGEQLKKLYELKTVKKKPITKKVQEAVDVKNKGKNLKVESQEINRFWSFAIGRLKNFNGTTIGHFYEYLKEIEFKYNHRNDDLFEQIISKITQN